MRRRLMVLAAAITTMVAVAFVVPLALLVQDVARDGALRAAETSARALAPVVATRAGEALEDAARATRTTTGDVTVFLADGSVIGAAGLVDEDVQRARQGEAFTTEGPAGAVVHVPVVRTDGTTAVVRVTVPAPALRDGVGEAWTLLGLLGLALVVGGTLVADRLGRSTVGAVAKLEQVATQLGRGHLDARADISGPPEVKEVAGALHVLADRIGVLLTAEREAVADLSHRVRTPLMALRPDVEALPPSRERDRLAADMDALEAAVTEVILQARRGRRAAVPPQTDLGEAVARRLDFWRVLAEEQGRAVTLETEPDLPPVALAEDDAHAVIDALVGNVLSHTPESVGFRVSVARAGGQCRLVVEDDGPGLAPDAIERGASGAESTGLGLDIVRQSAERSGGQLIIRSGYSGGGRVEVLLGIARRDVGD